DKAGIKDTGLRCLVILVVVGLRVSFYGIWRIGAVGVFHDAFADNKPFIPTRDRVGGEAIPGCTVVRSGVNNAPKLTIECEAKPEIFVPECIGQASTPV